MGLISPENAARWEATHEKLRGFQLIDNAEGDHMHCDIFPSKNEEKVSIR
jgi:hypothetical protein